MPFIMFTSIFIILYIVYIIAGVLFYDLQLFDYIDEIYPWLLFILFFFSKQKFSKPFIIFLCVSIFYFIYSLYIQSNVLVAICNDFIIEIKPFLTFFSLLCLRPVFTNKQIILLKNVSLYCVLVLVIVGVLHYGHNQTIRGEELTGAGYALSCILIALSYYLFSKHDNNNVKVICILICALGILRPTSKYIIEFACLIFLYYYVDTRKQKKASKYILTSVLLIFSSYFVYDFIRDDMMYFTNDGAARGVLFATSFDILNSYVPFGSGLASYATSASANWYSSIYAQFGIDNIYGLVDGETYFVSDTYFPVLAQFGYVGILLFVSFMYYVYNLAKRKYQYSGDDKTYRISLIILCIIVVESTSAATFIGNKSVLLMQLLALSLYDIKKHSFSSANLKPRIFLQ